MLCNILYSTVKIGIASLSKYKKVCLLADFLLTNSKLIFSNSDIHISSLKIKFKYMY